MLGHSRTLQLGLCFALCCLSDAATLVRVSGREGRDVNISCLYQQGYESYEKYLCKNDCSEDADVLIRSTEVKKDRYSTHDDKDKCVFVVTISGLTSTDAGNYWCGLTRNGYDSYPAQVNLEVQKEWCCVKTTHTSSTVGHAITLTCPHPPQHRHNRKFLCKGADRSSCTDVVTSGSRFTLQEDVSSSSFSVMITKLEEGDAGMYWCGSDSLWSVGNYTKIELSVEKRQRDAPLDKHNSHLEHFHDEYVGQVKMLIYIIPALLLTLLFALIIIYKCKAKVRSGRRKKCGALDMICQHPEDTALSKTTSLDDKKAEVQENVYQSLSSTEDVYTACH